MNRTRRRELLRQDPTRPKPGRLHGGTVGPNMTLSKRPTPPMADPITTRSRWLRLVEKFKHSTKTGRIL